MCPPAGRNYSAVTCLGISETGEVALGIAPTRITLILGPPAPPNKILLYWETALGIVYDSTIIRNKATGGGRGV